MDHPKRDQYHSSGKDSGRYKMILDTVQTDGIKAPIRVQKNTNYIIGGHLRRDAAIELGHSTVPVVYLDVEDDEAEYLLIMDNLDRMEDERDPIKIARQCKRLRDQEPVKRGRPVEGGNHNKASQSIHERLNMSKANFSRYLSLLRLIPPLQDLVSQLKIGLKAGAKLASMTPEQQKKVYESIQSRAENESNYRMTEQEASSFHDAFVDETQSEGSEIEEDDLVFENAADDTFYTTSIGESNPLLSEEAEEVSVTRNDPEYNALKSQDIALAAQYKIREPKHSNILNLSKEIQMDSEQARVVNGRTDEIAVEKMSSLLTIEDEKARRAFATKQATSSIRSFKLALERAEIDLVSELTLLEPQDYGQVLPPLQELNGLLKRVQDKTQRISEHMETQETVVEHDE
ncbi:ParB N-terminal domain-containing protein [Alicyclobacillus tolerans]|uniref:ParB/RepB/Spo0J family partition protein n=2 Tax=Alicyclobacillus tolerans TaxID=90970 RepID=UPI0023517F7D|nr:ParB N-terminal domain-containing protein [Alicyclobacillus tolerans]MCF8568531.1 ParB N-terminal domain-containing protein [Alicyclobacillus tolerans]